MGNRKLERPPFEDEALTLAESRAFALVEAIVANHGSDARTSVGNGSQDDEHVGSGSKFLDQEERHQSERDGHHREACASPLDGDEDLDLSRAQLRAAGIVGRGMHRRMDGINYSSS